MPAAHGSARDWACRDAWIEKSEIERRIVLPGGGSITVKSADNAAYLRGPRLDGVVMDEAAYISEEVWTAVIRPTLADSGGWAIFISTPNGLNWYYEAFEAAPRRAGWERWQLPTAANPMIPTEEIEEARATLLPLVFRQEWLAEFVSSVGAEIQPGWLRYFRMDGGEDTTRPDRYILLARGEDGAPRPLPVMALNPAVVRLEDFRYEDFQLSGYDPHPHIPAPVAV